MSLNYPFLKTTRDWSAEDYARFKGHGYDAVNFQAQNGNTIKNFNLGAARAAELRAEVWGVTYSADHFYENGKTLGIQAVKLGAEAVTMNAEMCAKDTRPSHGLRPIIDGVRAGGWAGPVNLNTLGTPINPLVNDFAMDTDSFLETGGGIACQAYFNAFDEYRPDLCMSYWRRIGIPFDRINLTLGLYDPAGDNPGRRQLSGAEYVPWLEKAGVQRGISIFLPETMLPNDLVELEVITKAAVAPIPPTNGDDDMEKIGSQHGIIAAYNRIKTLDPAGCNPAFDPNDYNKLPLDQLKAWDKDCRTKLILAKDHDEQL